MKVALIADSTEFRYTLRSRIDREPIAMEEQRAAPRHRTLLSGKILLQGGGVIDCLLRNRSAVGARLQMASVVGIPEDFTLVIEPAGERHAARVVWRKQTEIGVMFVTAVA